MTVSLSLDDWRTVRALAASAGETYSRVFHRLIELGSGAVFDSRRVAKYRAVLAPHSEFLAKRAKALSQARRRKASPA